PLEHLVERGLGAEKILFEAPERGEGGVVELEPRVGPVDRDRGRDRLQHLGMGGEMALELGLETLEIGEVARETEQVPARQRQLCDLDEAACAGDDDVIALGFGAAALARAFGDLLPAPGESPGKKFAAL